jgi:hypothetical protein
VFTSGYFDKSKPYLLKNKNRSALIQTILTANLNDAPKSLTNVRDEIITKAIMKSFPQNEYK